jgi:hypothetical protein
MALTDIAIGQDGDLVLDGEGNLVLVTGAEAIIQYIRIALSTQQGVYRFDKSFGSQLNELIGQTKLGANQKITLAKLYTMNCLKGIPFVKTINNVNAFYSKAYPNTISIVINCTVYTDEDLRETMSSSFGIMVTT